MNMEGKVEGGPQTTQSAPYSCRCGDRKARREEWPAGRRAVSPRSVHRPLVSLSLSHLAQAQPRGDRNAPGSSTGRASATSTGGERRREGDGRMTPWTSSARSATRQVNPRVQPEGQGRPSERTGWGLFGEAVEQAVGDSSSERQGLKGDHEWVNSPTGVSRWGHQPDFSGGLPLNFDPAVLGSESSVSSTSCRRR